LIKFFYRKKPEKWKSGFKQDEYQKAPASIPAPNSEHCLTQVIKQKLPVPTEKIAVFIFRRDLRIFDNTSLIAAAADGFKILPVFIFPPEQIDEKENDYFSHPCVQFMCLSLSQVHKELEKLGSKLHFIKLANADALTQLKKEVNFDAVYSNEDYSFYAVSRDQEVRSWCRENRVKFLQKEDYGMMKLDENLDKHNRPIRTHAAFMRGLRANCTVRRPTEVPWTPDNFVSFNLNCEIPEQQIHTFYETNPKLAVTPGTVFFP
jgi:deoxyribodipyrimidine photolyase